MNRFVVTAPPVNPPIELDDLKARLRIFRDDENELLARYTVEAAEKIGDDLKFAFINTGITEYKHRFDGDVIMLTWGPQVSSVTVKYYDADGVLQTLDPAVYDVVEGAVPGRIRLAFEQEWPTTRRHADSVEIEYTAGYGADETSVPDRIKGVIARYIGHLYEVREASGEAKMHETFKLAFANEIWALTARQLV